MKARWASGGFRILSRRWRPAAQSGTCLRQGHLEASVLPDAGLLRFEVSVRVAAPIVALVVQPGVVGTLAKLTPLGNVSVTVTLP